MFYVISPIIRCICCCISTVDDMGHEESISDIPFEIENHLGILKSSYILLYGYARRHQQLPSLGEVYRNCKLGDWVNSRLKLQESDTLSLHEIRAMAYIYDLLKMNPSLTDHQKRVISCPVLLVTLWADPEISARYILLWCFVSQFNRYPSPQEVYYNFAIGAWYNIIINDVSTVTQKSLKFIQRKLQGPKKPEETIPLLPK